MAHFTIGPRFGEVRTAGHNPVCARARKASITPCQVSWYTMTATELLLEEIPVRRTRLQLQPVFAACMAAAPTGRLPHWHGDGVCVGNSQQGLVLVSHSPKWFGLLDLCSPFDSHSELLAAARLEPRQRKLCTY
jgi:hypothetical protein